MTKWKITQPWSKLSFRQKSSTGLHYAAWAVPACSGIGGDIPDFMKSFGGLSGCVDASGSGATYTKVGHRSVG